MTSPPCYRYEWVPPITVYWALFGNSLKGNQKAGCKKKLHAGQITLLTTCYYLASLKLLPALKMDSTSLMKACGLTCPDDVCIYECL